MQAESDKVLLTKGGRTIFFPLQDPYDEVSHLKYMSPAEVLRVIVATIDFNDVIYVKKHPVDKTIIFDNLKIEFNGNEKIRFVDASVHDLFKISDFVVTINSGVGFEAALAGIPVIMAGKSDYNVIATTVMNANELVAAVNNPELISEDDKLRFMFVYFQKYAINPNHTDDFNEKLDELFGNINS